MGSALGKITDWTGITNIKEKERAGQIGREASELEAQYRQEALDYLMEQEQAATEAKGMLSGLYGIGGADPNQTLATLQASPIYQSILGTQGAGEEAIMRQSAMTGGLRSGTTQGALGQYGQQLELSALTNALSGLGNIAATSQSPLIAQTMSGIGQTLGEGMVAEAEGMVAGSESLRDFARQERGYGHDVGMSFLGGVQF